jgi:hypothetical protein
MASWYRCGRASRQCGGREEAKRGERNSGGFVTQFTGSVAAKAYPSALATDPRRLNLGKGIHMIDSNTKREMRRLEDEEIDRVSGGECDCIPGDDGTYTIKFASNIDWTVHPKGRVELDLHQVPSL